MFPPEKIGSQGKNGGGYRSFFVALTVLFSVIPVICAVWLIYSSSVNALTNDYVELAPRICRMIEPGYQWLNFPRDCSQSSHCYVLPVLVHLANIILFKWNIPLELYLGLALCLARVILLDKMINPRSAAVGGGPALNAAVTVAIFALSFDASNVAVFLYNLTAIAYGIALLFFIAGLYALYRYGNTRPGLALMLLCGWAAALSHGGSAIFSWLAYAIYVILCPAKNRRYGLAACLSGLFVSAICVYFLIQSGGIHKATAHPHLPALAMYLQCFALPFLKNSTDPVAFTPGGIATGAFAWVCLIVFLVINLKNRPCSKAASVAFALAAFGAINIFTASMLRTFVAPWYGTFTTLFWLAILALAANHQSKGQKGTGGRLLTLVPVLAIYILFFCSNLSYRDKDSFRESHCPATETATRNFDSAPTYAEASLCSFTIGDYSRVPTLVRPLARHGLTCFSQSGDLLLQGEFLLPAVCESLPTENSEVHWVSGQSLRKVHEWNEPEHLNLALFGKAALVWPVDLKNTTGPVLLKTGFCAASRKKNQNKESLSVAGKLQVFDARDHQLLSDQKFVAHANWSRLQLDLKGCHNNNLEIAFSADSAKNSDLAVLFQAPSIELNLAQPELSQRPAKDQPANQRDQPDNQRDQPDNQRDQPDNQRQILEEGTKPCNTDLSAAFDGMRPGDNLWPPAKANWRFEGMTRISPEGHFPASCQLNGPSAAFTYSPGLNLPVRHVNRLYIELAVPKNVSPRAVCCQMVINGNHLRQVFIPLLADEKFHRYTYDLKLCNFGAGDAITGLKILPIFTVAPPANCRIEFGNAGFLKPDHCLVPDL